MFDFQIKISILSPFKLTLNQTLSHKIAKLLKYGTKIITIKKDFVDQPIDSLCVG